MIELNNQTLESIQNRRSTRQYQDKQISDEELQILLDAGIQAPSAMNLQSWHFTVVQNQELINYISDQSKKGMSQSSNQKIASMGNSDMHIFYKAPTVIIVSGKKEVGSALVDCSAAIQNMLIAGESIGLGTVWVGFSRFFFQLGEGVEKLNIPDGYEPFYAIAVGYKQDKSAQGPSPRKGEVINYVK